MNNPNPKGLALASPIRVLQVYRTYFPETQGGLQEAVRQLSLGLRQCGVHSDVFTLAKNPHPARIETPEAAVFRCRSVAEIASCDIGSLASLASFKALAKQYDILNFHYPWPFGDLLALAASAGKPYVITYHSDIVRQRAAEYLYAPLRSLFFARARAVVATSPVYALTSDFLMKQNRSVECIPLGLDEKCCAGLDEGRRKHWGQVLPPDFFLFVGVLRYYKGLDYLIEAARTSGLPVVIAGDGPERARLELLARDLPNVKFLGHVNDPDKFALLSLARAVVFPSHLRAEAFGVTLLEGGVSGKALISTEIGTGTSYVNQHGETGLVVPPADAPALADAMLHLASNPLIADTMGAAAAKRCRETFSAAQMGRAYRDLYAGVLRPAVAAELPTSQGGGVPSLVAGARNRN